MMTKLWTILMVLLVSGAALASEQSVYDFSWLDKDKEIYVLQNRKFRKDGRLYVGAGGIQTLSGAFIDSFGGTLRGGYFMREDWGVEFLYSKFSGKENTTAKGVKTQGTVPFYRKTDSMMGALVWWSPFYGKLNTFNQIFYFDWMFGAGVSSLTSLDNRNKFKPGRPDSLTSESNIAGLWSTAVRFHITQTWSLRMDFLGSHYYADKQSSASDSSEKLFSNYDFGLSLMYAF